MMKIKTLAAVALLAATAIPASAQFVGGNSVNTTSPQKSQESRKFPRHYNRFMFGYNAGIWYGSESSRFNFDKRNYDEGNTMNGFAFQYTHGFGLSNRVPIYLDFGLRFNLGLSFSDGPWRKADECDMLKFDMSIPVNVGYRLGFGENVSLMPYTGFHLKANLAGNIDIDGTSYDPFDKYDVGEEYQWTRAQFGWQLGVAFTVKKFFLGLEYGLDFNSLYDGCNTSDLLLSLGVQF